MRHNTLELRAHRNIKQHFIKLWEQRNKCIHGHNINEQAHTTRTKHTSDIRTLYTLRYHIRSRDNHVFSDNNDAYPQKLPTNTLAQYISTNREVILNSVGQAQKKLIESTRPFKHWFKPVSTTRSTQQQSWQQDNLIHDAYSNEMRGRHHSRTRQIAITQI